MPEDRGPPRYLLPIAALAEIKTPLIRLRGQWVAVDSDQLRRGLEFLAKNSTGQATTAEILALAASHPDDTDTPLEATAVRADGWLGDLPGGAPAQSLQPLAPPPEFTARLRPYQQRGLAWLAFLSSLGLGSCLADDMGLGKTVQLLAWSPRNVTTSPVPRRRCRCARCRWSATGNGKPRNSRRH